MQRPMSRVLMVDDAGLFRVLEGSFLRRLGCEIVRAQDGPDLIRKATDNVPSLILLDEQRPDLDGAGCIRALKSNPVLAAIPVLMVTSSDGVKGCCEAGADATLTRPIESGALDLALSSLGRGGHREGVRRSAAGWARVVASGRPRRARLKDISGTGAFLALPEPLPLHEIVGLSLHLEGPGGTSRVSVRGIVVRQVGPDPNSHLIPGVGVRFTEIDALAQSAIDRYVGRSRLETGGRGADEGGADRP
ncbi:MAG TPA: PilZ domain-containing protein [Candidatus Polarisedimenticolia bacterium]|nr:PilZ domain-containing protein [Candidatus Polarisedimenticolia bacterium]